MRYLIGMLVLLLIWSCDCEENYACRDLTALVGTNELLDSIWLQVPNVLSDEELSHVLVHTFSLDGFDMPAIVAFDFEISIDDGFSYQTSDTCFIAKNGRYITVPQDIMYENSNYIEGYASYSLKIFLDDTEGYIGIVDGEILLVTCERFNSGAIGDKECRFAFQIFPPSGFSDGPSSLICRG